MPDAAPYRTAFQQALSEDEPSALYEQAPCGYVSTAVDGSVLKANATFLAWTGFAREDVVGRRRFADLLTRGGRIYFETHLNPLLHMSGEVREIALDLLRPDGTQLPVLLNAVVGRDPHGNPEIVRFAVFDATERRRYEGELVAAKRRAEESEERAVRLARTLQETLIPPRLPVVPGLELAAEYRPAGDGDEVGGDFYDVFQVAEGDWAVVLGDVSGKGVEAAVITALVRHTARALVVREPLPSQVLAGLNDVLDGYDTDRFCTVVVLRLRRTDDRWQAVASSGGHPLPILLRPGVQPQPLGTSGSLVGAFDDVEYDDVTVTMAPGDTLLLYTDGITEGRRGGDFYGDERLLALLARDGATGAASVVDRVVTDVLEYQEQRPRDDIAVLAVEVPLLT